MIFFTVHFILKQVIDAAMSVSTTLNATKGASSNEHIEMVCTCFTNHSCIGLFMYVCRSCYTRFITIVGTSSDDEATQVVTATQDASIQVCSASKIIGMY